VTKDTAADGDGSRRLVERGGVELAQIDGKALLELVERRCEAVGARDGEERDIKTVGRFNLAVGQHMYLIHLLNSVVITTGCPHTAC
jgi:hypothetical protein